MNYGTIKNRYNKLIILILTFYTLHYHIYLHIALAPLWRYFISLSDPQWPKPLLLLHSNFDVRMTRVNAIELEDVIKNYLPYKSHEYNL